MIDVEYIFIEEDAVNSPISRNIFQNFDNARIITEKTDFEKRKITDKRKVLWVKNHEGDFIKACPGTKNMRCCNYVILNQMINCPYNCTYCYLQIYLNNPYIYIYANTDKMLGELSDYLDNKKHIRIGTGEFTDSLNLDMITGFSKIIVPYFKKFPDNILELKTKSVEIENLLKIDHSGNVVVSWSLNPDILIR